MNNWAISKQKIVKVALILLVIVGLLLTMHILVNSFDLFGFLRRLHGG